LIKGTSFESSRVGQCQLKAQLGASSKRGMHIMRQNANGMGAINHVTYVVVHRPASHAKRVHQRGINISSTYTAVHRPASHAKSFEATMQQQQQQQATGMSAVVPSRTVVGTGDGAFSSVAAQASVGVVAAQAHGVESDDLQQDLQPSPAAPVVEPMGHHGRSEEILLEEEEDSGAPAAPPIASVPTDGPGQQQHASDGAAVEPRVERRSSGEILSDEEEVSRQAAAATSNAGVPADRRQETDVERGGEQLPLPQASDGAAVVPRAGGVDMVGPVVEPRPEGPAPQ
jgi:hypothetical protein